MGTSSTWLIQPFHARREYVGVSAFSSSVLSIHTDARTSLHADASLVLCSNVLAISRVILQYLFCFCIRNMDLSSEWLQLALQSRRVDSTCTYSNLFRVLYIIQSSSCRL